MGGTPSNPPAIMAIPRGMRNRETDNHRFRGRFCARWIPLRFRLRIKDNLGRGSKHISLITASFLRISLKYHSPPEGVNSRAASGGPPEPELASWLTQRNNQPYIGNLLSWNKAMFSFESPSAKAAG